MDSLRKIKDLAKSEGFDVVKHLGQWEGLEVYGVDSSVESFVGLPQFILVSGDDVKWASVEQGRKIMALGII